MRRTAYDTAFSYLARSNDTMIEGNNITGLLMLRTLGFQSTARDLLVVIYYLLTLGT